MVKALVWFTCIVALGASELRVREVRALYWRSNDDKVAAQTLFSQLENVKEGVDQPILLGYKGSSHMMLANHVKDPFKKLSLFNKGRAYLDRSIAIDKYDAELRFQRFAVQINTPGFLGYNENIEEDKKIILQALPSITDEDLQSKIIVFMLDADEVSTAEKMVVKRLQSTIQ